ncbi:hypothetical protein K474DRAFT_1656777 [Panus rudis PR-1116 ss-1]|nr:hypothetical protein K474DRAFT_1656777 [Panus rudis PR-1116 ss-1]
MVFSSSLSAVPIVTHAVSVFADALILFFSCKDAVCLVRDMGQLSNFSPALSRQIIKNGSAQFGAMLALNSIAMAFDVASVATDNTITFASEFIWINIAVSSILVSRFLLELRSVAQGGFRLTDHDNEFGGMSSIQFHDMSPLDISMSGDCHPGEETDAPAMLPNINHSILTDSDAPPPPCVELSQA